MLMLPHGPPVRLMISREVISFGFWFGDDRSPEPAFYSHTTPEPDGLDGGPLRPPAARWVPRNGSHLAVMPYGDARAEASLAPACWTLMRAPTRPVPGWPAGDIQRLASSGGITDP